ncbi:MAG: methyltransferase family protein [Candidatus Hodarchaeales archaeon]
MISILFPDHRIWPPPCSRSWQFWYTWILFGVAALGIPVIGIEDWGSLGLYTPVAFAIGMILIIGGLLLALWGIRTLSTRQTSGLTGNFVKEGPYKFTRNPQYLGDSLAIAGLILVTNSVACLILGLLGIAWFVLAPISEEPWLGKQFGEEYEQFCRDIPRFFSWKVLIFKKEK